MTVSFTLDKTKVKPGETVVVNWTLRNEQAKSYPFKIEFTINGSPLRTIDLGTVYSGQTKTGSFTFIAPKTPKTYTVKAVSLMEVMPYNWVDDDSYIETLTVEGVDIESVLMQELKRWYKKNVTVPGVTKSYDWSFDVTDTVIESGLIKNVDKAYLYGWYEIRSYSYAGKERPPKRSARDKVSGWQDGIELALLNIGTDVYPIPEEYAGWYWVTVPCKLVVVQKEAPKARIFKDVSIYPDGLGGIVYNGRVLPPGSHTVTKGSIIEYRALAENIGGSGTIWIRLLSNGKVIAQNSSSNKTVGISGKLTIDSDVTLKFEAGHGDVKDDEWGC